MRTQCSISSIPVPRLNGRHNAIMLFLRDLATPYHGLVWVEGTTGIAWTYVVDGDSGQWVELGAAGTASSVPTAAGTRSVL